MRRKASSQQQIIILLGSSQHPFVDHQSFDPRLQLYFGEDPAGQFPGFLVASHSFRYGATLVPWVYPPGIQLVHLPNGAEEYRTGITRSLADNFTVTITPVAGRTYVALNPAAGTGVPEHSFAPIPPPPPPSVPQPRINATRHTASSCTAAHRATTPASALGGIPRPTMRPGPATEEDYLACLDYWGITRQLLGPRRAPASGWMAPNCFCVLPCQKRVRGTISQDTGRKHRGAITEQELRMYFRDCSKCCKLKCFFCMSESGRECRACAKQYENDGDQDRRGRPSGPPRDGGAKKDRDRSGGAGGPAEGGVRIWNGYAV